MILNWRRKKYKFENGRLEYKPSKYSDIDNKIYGFDTESIDLGDRFEVQTIQISSEWQNDLWYIKTDEDPLLSFIINFWNTYQKELQEEKQVFMFGYNIIYDWGQLIKKNEKLYTILKTGIGQRKNLLIYEIGKLKVYLKGRGLFTGNAPFWSIMINYGRKQNVTINFRDAWSYFSGGLGKASKMLGIETKKERDEDIGRIDYRTMEDCKRKQDFELYAKTDAKVTRLLGEKIRQLHSCVNLPNIKVSSPGYAITLLLKSHDEILFKGHNKQEIMQTIIDGYSGGRTGGIYHGYVENLSVLDINSSYPCSMYNLPSFTKSMHYIEYDDTENLTLEELIDICNNYHCFVTVSGEEKNNKYPTLVKEKKNKNNIYMLTPIFGKFENVTTTGVELIVGINNKTLIINKIHKLIILSDENKNETGFQRFVKIKYADKKSKDSDSIEYTSAKLCLNAGYGKLIESRTEVYIDADVKNIIVPIIDNETEKFANIYYQEYLESDNKEEFENSINEMLEKINTENITDYIYKSFGELSLTNLEYGRYVIPAAAALITAISRARLLSMMISFEAIYWDTDSIFILDNKNIDEKINNANKLLSKIVQPIGYSDKELGDIKYEIKNARGYLGGIKRYNIYNDEGKKKTAVHGVPSCNYNEVDKILEALATGYNIEYEGRAKPLKAKTSNINTLGKFEQKKYTSIFELDSRLNWTKVNNGWYGTVKEFDEV